MPLLLGASLFATGLVAGRLARPASPPLLVEHAAMPQPPATPSQPSARDAASRGDAATPAERVSGTEEVVSICGARTQKGTPCSRRVRGTGRCWQHTGMPAMLPLEKRLLMGK